MRVRFRFAVVLCLLGSLLPAGSMAAPQTNGLSLWFNAESLAATLADGAAVAAWTDDSGNGRHALQATVANRPVFQTNVLNGLPVVRFDGTSGVLGYDGAFLTNTDYTIFFVEARGSSKAPNHLFGGTDNRADRNLHIGYRNDAQFTHAHYGRDYNMDVPAYSTPRFRLFSLHLDNTGATGRQTYTNGVFFGGDAQSNVLLSYTDAQVGRYGGGTYYQGDIAEILMYDQYLDSAERNQVGYYLAERYGLESAYVDPNAADIAVSIEADRVNAAIGDTIVYRVTAVNNGFTNASAVIVSNMLPASLTFDTHTGGSYDDGTGDWTIGDLAYLASTTLTVRATVKAGAVNSVIKIAAGRRSATEADPAPANDAASVSVRVRDELNPGGFAHKVRIDFPGYTGSETLTNFPALVVLNEGIQDFDYDLFASAQGNDLRFVSANGTTLLYHDVETWDATGDSYVWVQVGALAAGSHIWACFGNPFLTAEPSFETGGYAWEQDYVGVWHMTETDALDSSPFGNHGTAGGTTGVSLDDGRISGGVLFPGSAANGGHGYINVPSSESLKTGDSLTFSAWVLWDRDTPLGHGRIASKKTVWDGNSGWMVTRQSNVNTNLDIRGSGGTVYQPGVTDSWTNNNWEHLTVVFDGATATAYSSGSLVGSGAINPVQDADVPLVIGNNASYTEWNWGGIIDELRVADTTRSADWVRNTWLTSASNAAFTSIGPVQGPPRIENRAATNITGSSAFMNGELVFDASAPATVHLLWGETDGGAAWGAWDNTNALTVQPVGPISTEITGLTELTSYRYAYYASNANGEAWATPSEAFTTLKDLFWTVTPSAGPGGAVDPADPQRVSDGADSPVFTFPPDTGYHLTNVVVDGAPVGVTNSYQFVAVTTNHAIEALFGINHYTVTVAQASNGEITPTGQVDVTYGSTPEFAVTPDAGYYVSDVLVDGTSVGPANAYTFPPMTGAVSITAAYTNVPLNMVMTSNLVLWLDAATISQTNTELVTEWRDYSGRGNHARQPVELWQPQLYTDKNGSHLFFDGVADFMRVLNESQFDFQANMTVLVVGQHTSPAGQAWEPFIAKNGEPTGWQFREYGTTDGLSLTTRGAAWLVPAADGPQGLGDIRTVGVFVGRFDGATSTKQLWHNGTPDGTLVVSAGLISTNDVAVTLAARDNNGIGGWAQCELYEVLVYDGALTDDEVNSAGYYLQGKYGIDGAFVDPLGPTVANTRADPIRRNGATLNAELVSTGSAPTTAWAVWDTVDKGTTNPAAWTGMAAMGEQPEGMLSTVVGGLQSDAVYCYRFIASNAHGVAWSPSARRFDTGVRPANHPNSLRVQFTGYSGTTPLTNFPALVTLSEGMSNFSYETMATEYGADLRFTDSEREETLFYEIDTWARRFQGTSIGPSGAGSTSFDGTNYTVVGQGNDIWGQTDSFHYAWVELPGDGAIEARVANITNPGGNGWAKVGVMIRETLDADSAFAFVALRPTDGAAWQWRDSTAAAPGWQDPGSAGAPPRWLKLERSGSNFVSFTSTDGSTWTEEGRRTIAMATNVYMGLAVCSHVVGTPTTVDFDNVGLNGAVGRSHVWVRVPEIASSEDYIWAFWGNPAATEVLPYTVDGSTWSEGFEGVYHLKEGDTNSAARDASMALNDGAPTAGPWLADGLIGRARELDGTHKFTVGPGLDLSEKAFTLSVWMNRGGDSAGDHMVFGGGVGQDSRGIHCGFRYQDPNDKIWFGLYGDDGRCDTDYGGDKGSWHYYTWVLDGTNQKQIYRDGIAVPTIGSMADFYKSAGLAIGAQHGGGTSCIGVLDEVRASPGAVRSPDWIQASYSNQVAGSTFITFSAEPPEPPGTVLMVR